MDWCACRSDFRMNLMRRPFVPLRLSTGLSMRSFIRIHPVILGDMPRTHTHIHTHTHTHTHTPHEGHSNSLSARLMTTNNNPYPHTSQNNTQDSISARISRKYYVNTLSCLVCALYFQQNWSNKVVSRL